jgi:hypothetical protein
MFILVQVISLMRKISLSTFLREIAQLDVKKSIKVEILEGPIKGKKTIVLNTIENNITRIDVEWDIKIDGLFGIFTGMIKKHILKGTEEALEEYLRKYLKMTINRGMLVTPSSLPTLSLPGRFPYLIKPYRTVSPKSYIHRAPTTAE